MRRTYWTKERIAELAKQYESRTEFREGHQHAYVVARTNGWLDEVCDHMSRKTRVDSGVSKRGYKDVKRVAKKCKTRGELLRVDRSAYEIARVNGWLDDICAHMVWVKKPKTKKKGNK